MDNSVSNSDVITNGGYVSPYVKYTIISAPSIMTTSDPDDGYKNEDFNNY